MLQQTQIFHYTLLINLDFVLLYMLNNSMPPKRELSNVNYKADHFPFFVHTKMDIPSALAQTNMPSVTFIHTQTNSL